MASIPLEFPPPAQEGLVALHIYIAPASTGPFVEYEVVTTVGTYPDYISNYTITGVNPDDWAAIAWEDAGGALSDLSNPIKGGTETLVGIIVDRVLQRDGTMSRAVVTQEAEAAIESYFGGIDPYDEDLINPIPNYRTLRGLTNLVLANSMLLTLIQSAASTETATIGLITLKEGSSSGSSLKLREIEALITLANLQLGLSVSIVMQMEEIQQRCNILELMEP